jgi:exodeoxyribonuclease VII large subunit
VGHEVDTTIADFVADARASTPTKAGVIAVPDMEEVLERINSMERHLERQAGNQLEVCKGKLERVLASAVFRNPLWVLNGPMQRLDETAGQLNDCLRRLLEAARRRIEAAREKLLLVEPHRLMGQRAVELGRCESGVTAAIKSVFAKKQLQITALENRLSGLNPKSVLNRGYSITVNKGSGKVVSSVSDVEIGDVLVTELADKHKIESEIKKK